MPATLAISLVIYNGEEYLPHCLDSLFQQSYQDWHLFILDNGSKDNSVRVIEQVTHGRSHITILPIKKHNNGFAKAHNEVMQQIDSPYVMLLNQDIILEHNYLKFIVDFLDNNKQVGSCSGKLLRWHLQNDTPIKTDIIDSVGLQINNNFQVVDIASGQQDLMQYNDNKRVFGISGALACYRNDALKEVGYFDTRFFSYKEDVDLAFRLYYAKWQAYTLGKALSYHARSLQAESQSGNKAIIKSRRQKSLWRNYLSYRNHWYILIKNVSLLDYIKYGIFIGWYELKKIVYLIIFEPSNLYALIEILRFVPQLLRDRRKIKPISVKQWIKS